ncbi:MAG: 50S ribosomal protein L10 [Flavobacteriales bacterium]|nr:50S ribosomal protein L10 [Flavobacteriales bacterium]MBL0128161.1 50S ribosomal protein L10 [Flavobacteriales bacterium]MCC6939717.1 50S ribosomal protein L10 [Flavobacteriales bacterium]
MATRTQKDEMIAELISEIKTTNVIYLADTSAMSAETTSKLRRACNGSGIRMRVVKNTLLQKAMEGIEDKDYSALFPTLAGNTAIMFAEKGNAPAKLIQEFRRKNPAAKGVVPKPQLKSAWIDEAVFIGDEQIAMLSNLKGKEELIGDIIALLQSPLKNVIGGLQASGGQKIAGLVKALEERAQA